MTDLVAGRRRDSKRRRGRPRHAALLTLALALAGLANVPSSASTPEVASARASDPYIADGPYGVTIEDTTLAATKAKVQFKLPTLYLRGNLGLCAASATSDGIHREGDGSDIPALLEPGCAKLLGVPIPKKYLLPETRLVGGTFQSYVVSSPGPNPSYGTLPPVTVHALAFGSVPVSVRVHLQQTATAGLLDPITATEVDLANFKDDDAGKLAYPGLPPVPPVRVVNGSSLPPQLSTRLSVNGTFDVKIDDVRIDGRRVDVGSDCGTTGPSRLSSSSAKGYFYGLPDEGRGKPGGFRPLGRIGGYFDGTVNIDPFQNCGTQSEDLDPLLTRLISSPRNPASGYLAYGLFEVESIWCNLPIANCTPSEEGGQRRMRAVAKSLTTATSGKSLDRLLSTLRPSDSALPRVAPIPGARSGGR